MKYEKLEMEVVQFRFNEFMTGSLDPATKHCDDYYFNGNHCQSYTQSQSCSDFDYGSYHCGTFNNNTCNNYRGYVLSWSGECGQQTCNSYSPGYILGLIYTCGTFRCSNGF